MIRLTRDSDTAVIVVHEIYGLNSHMSGVCRSLADNGFDVFCPNLLMRDAPFAYSEEEEAYAHFTRHVGFAKARSAVDGLLQELEGKHDRVFVVGFSAGATAAWLCAEDSRVAGIAGYYGSRIRDYLDIVPRCPALLLFPQEEKSFEVDDVIAALSRKSHVDIEKFEGLHGFGDPYSPRYHEASAARAFGRVLTFLRERQTI